jgi:hypothetical protein
MLFVISSYIILRIATDKMGDRSILAHSPDIEFIAIISCITHTTLIF